MRYFTINATADKAACIAYIGTSEDLLRGLRALVRRYLIRCLSLEAPFRVFDLDMELAAELLDNFISLNDANQGDRLFICPDH